MGVGLFPIRERGVNPQAVPLQPHEARSMQNDPIILGRLLRSYEMVCPTHSSPYTKSKDADGVPDVRVLRDKL
jgi:hypothetical protein